MIVFSRVLFGRWVFWQRDISLYWYPQAEAFVRVIASGAWPVWNPYMSFGLPLLADPSYQILYPFTWLNLVMLPATFYKLYVFAHVTAAGAGAYLLVRRWGVGRFAAFVAGASWMASGPLLVVVSHTHHLAGTAWLPWVLLALDHALASGTLAAGMLLGAAAAGQLFAGSGDLCLMSGFASLGYLLAFVLGGGVPVGRRVRAAVPVVLVAAPFAAMLSAVQWLPAIAILRSGQRLQLDPSVKMYWSLHPASLLDLWVPRFVNDLPANAAARAALFESREALFACIYVGAGATALVAASMALRFNRFKAFAAGGFVFSILAALGRHTICYPFLIRVTPLFLFRYPEKYVIPAGFFWALLVGLAVEDWLSPREIGTARWRVAAALAGLVPAALLAGSVVTLGGPAPLMDAVQPIGPLAREYLLAGLSWKWIGPAVVAAAVATLAWLRARRPSRAAWSAALVAALVLVDLAAVGRTVNPLAPPELMRRRPALLDRVPTGSRVWVSMSKPPEWLNRQVIRGPAGWEWQWWWSAALRDMIWPPTGARWGLRGSFDGDFTGLAPPLLSNLTLVLRNAAGSLVGRRVLQIGGVDYVVGTDDWPPLEEAGRIASTLAEPIRLYHVPGTLPRAYAVRNARVAAEPRSVEILGDPSFDPAAEIVVPPGAEPLSGPPGPPDPLRELWRRADSVGLEVDASAPAYVVALESFYSGWRARVDDRPVGIVRANVLFQAVPVPAGRHTVVLEYRPTAVAWGGALTAAAVALGLATPLRRRRPSRAGLPDRVGPQ